MFAIALDESVLARKLDSVEKKELRFALVLSFNQTAFETRNAWARLAATRFDAPTPLTTGAVLYTKATKANLGGAEIFLRDKVGSGAPPSQYLKPEEFGGPRPQKGFERRLLRIPGGRLYYVPGRNAPLDQFGNIRPSLLRKIINELSATGGGDQPGLSPTKRNKRRRTSGYFLLRRARGKLIAGAIYQRGAKGRGATRTEGLKGILFPVSHAPRYRPRFGALPEAKKIVNARFPIIFKQTLAKLVAQARARA